MKRRTVLACVAPLLAPPAWAQLKTGDNPEGSERWQKVRAAVFAGRDIADDGDHVAKLDVPARAEDAALMPLAIRAQFPQSPERHIRRVWLVIDNNPSPLSSVFTYTLASGQADVSTRVRIDEYTFVRAISETQDGRLHASTRFVKAAGGCSAPPGRDAAAAAASLGRMRLAVIGTARAQQPVQAQLMLSHPNDSGFVLDQVSRQYTPPHFVRRVDVRYAGELVLSADVDFSISENPNLRFYFTPQQDGELSVQVVDSKDLTFEDKLLLRVGS